MKNPIQTGFEFALGALLAYMVVGIIFVVTLVVLGAGRRVHPRTLGARTGASRFTPANRALLGVPEWVP